MKKIAIGIHCLTVGGAEVLAVNTANGFAELGYETHLVVIKNKNNELKNLISPKVKLINLRVNRKILALPKLTYYLLKEKPDYFISAIYYHLLAALAGLLARRTKVIILEIINASQTLKSAPNLITKILYTFSLLTYRFARGIISCSEGSKSDLRKFVGNKEIKVIHNPVVEHDFQIKMQQDITLPNIPEKYILAVARLHPQKDLPTLFEAFAKLRKKKDIKLLLMGEGEERKNLEWLAKNLGIENDVLMPGNVENLWPYYKKARMFVLSSKYEGFGNVVAMALASGTPTVSTNCPSGPAEILENGKYGRLVPVADPDSLAKAMLETLEEEENEAKRMGRINRGMDFTITGIVREYEQYMLSI